MQIFNDISMCLKEFKISLTRLNEYSQHSISSFLGFLQETNTILGQALSKRFCRFGCDNKNKMANLYARHPSVSSFPQSAVPIGSPHSQFSLGVIGNKWLSRVQF